METLACRNCCVAKVSMTVSNSGEGGRARGRGLAACALGGVADVGGRRGSPSLVLYGRSLTERLQRRRITNRIRLARQSSRPSHSRSSASVAVFGSVTLLCPTG